MIDILSLTGSTVSLRLSKKEVNIILQCTDEIRDKWSENDIQTVMACTGEELKTISVQMEEIYVRMDNSPS